VNTEGDGSRSLLCKKDRQFLDFTAVDIGGGGAGKTYWQVSRDPFLDGGSVDCDSEDSTDDGEELCGEHHGAG
jgi:hypothetical protein